LIDGALVEIKKCFKVSDTSKVKWLICNHRKSSGADHHKTIEYDSGGSYCTKNPIFRDLGRGL